MGGSVCGVIVFGSGRHTSIRLAPGAPERLTQATSSRDS
jgi:hypothetical protein